MVKNSLQSGQKKMGLTAFLSQEAVKRQVNDVVGKDGQRFITSIVSAVNTNSELQECTNQSILSTALLGQALELSPSPQLGHFYFVPFKDKEKGKVAQFILGYKGMIQLAIRSGQYKKINVLAIKEGELINYDPLNEEIEVELIDDEEKREKANTIGYYAMFELTNGFRKTLYWSRAKMESHAERFSPGYRAKKGYTFWEKDFDSMAFKTMLRQLISKWGIMSIELQKGFEADKVEKATQTKDDTVIDVEVSESVPVRTHEEVKEQVKEQVSTSAADALFE